MAKKRDLVWEGFYLPHLAGNGFRHNPVNDDQRMAESMYLRHLTELAMNRFKWTNLPKSVDPRFLELQLFRQALVVFYKDQDFARHLALAGAPVGGMNHYDNPVAFTTYGNKYTSKRINATDCVPIWANMMRTPDYDIVRYYSKRLATLDRTIEINSMNLRQPRMVYANENTRLSYENLSRQIDEGVPVIKGQENALDPSNVQVLDLGGDPVGIINLQIARSQLWNQAMTMLGINNANQDKKERLVADEVAANDDQVFATRGIALNSRKLACELINKKFTYADGTPLNVQVEFNTDSEPPEAPDEMGGALAPMGGVNVG